MPHIYGANRDGAVFGTGYAAAEDRLRSSLKAALKVPASELHGDDEVCEEAGQKGDQRCYDSVRFRPVGGATQPLIPWINRPTYQQVNEIQGRAPR